MSQPMTDDEIRQEILKAIRSVAPETDFDAIDPAAPLRDQMDLDSMDFLRCLVKVHERTGVDIPEADYSRLGTLNDFVAYLRQKIMRKPQQKNQKRSA